MRNVFHSVFGRGSSALVCVASAKPFCRFAGVLLLLFVVCCVGEAQQRGVLEGGRLAPIPPPSEPAQTQQGDTNEPGEQAADESVLRRLLSVDVESLDYDGLLNAVVGYVEKQTLRSVPPALTWQSLQNMLRAGRQRRRSPQEQRALDLLKNLLDWQEHELAYTTSPSEQVLRRSSGVVKAQAKLDPEFDEERLQRILQTMQSKGLFVPSSILFRRFVLPYRPMRIPQGGFVLEVPAKPEYQDAEHEVSAVVDFLAALAPFCRIDFETVGTAELRVEKSEDGKRFDRVQTWTSQQRGGLRGPVFLQPPVKTRFLSVTTVAPAETAVLRNLRFFAVKEPAVASCPRTPKRPFLDGDFKESAWPRTAQVDGFVDASQCVFASTQTTIRLVYDDDYLYVAGYMREPRQTTRVAQMTHHDDALWEEESLELTVMSADGVRYRFVVNPLGTRFESRNGDVSWDMVWQAVTRDYPLGWAAEIAIPLSSFEGNVMGGKTVRMNFLRNRKNVVTERSSWAYSPDNLEEAMGKVTLD